jgi:hypothetical protein
MCKQPFNIDGTIYYRMKRKLIILFLIVSCPLIEAQKILNLKTMNIEVERQIITPIRDIEEGEDGIIVTYNIEKVTVCKDFLNDNASQIKIHGFWPSTNEGDPSILLRWDSFVVPDANSKVRMVDSSYVDVPLELAPARKLLENSGYESYTKDNVKPIRKYSGYYPNTVVSDVTHSKYREKQIVDVCIRPIQYDYENKKIRIFTKIKYKVDYCSSVSRDSVRGNRDIDDTFLDNVTVNGNNDAKMRYNPSLPPLELVNKYYLILSVPKYTPVVQRFAEWKRILGFDVIVDVRSTWTTQTIADAIRDEYEAHNIKYFLIIGGQNDLPAQNADLIFNGIHHYHPTDLYYACMNNTYLPDIMRGRIPVNTLEEANIVIDKIISYEKRPIVDNTFYNTGIHCAFFQDTTVYNQNGTLQSFKDGYEDRRFTLTSERIRDRMLNLNKNIHRIYYANGSVNPTNWNYGTYANGEDIPTELKRPTFPWNGDSIQITTKIHQKAFYILQRDHGNKTYWGRPRYDTNNIRILNNGQYLPVVFSISCLTGKFDEPDCFCETFLKKENGGCVAIFGATQSSLSGLNDVLAEGMFDAIWPSDSLWPQFPSNNPSYSATPTPTFRLGQILDQGLRRVHEAYNDSRVQYTYELFHCFGDPSMQIYTSLPTAFPNTTVVRQNGVITVNTGGCTAIICYYNRSTGEIKCYHGTNHTYPDSPDISVCVSAHNKIPYIDGGNIYIQNRTLTSNEYFESSNIFVGNHVTSNSPYGNVTFQSGNYQLRGNRVELNAGTTISTGATVVIGN